MQRRRRQRSGGYVSRRARPGQPCGASSRKNPRSRRLAIETLEARLLLDGVGLLPEIPANIDSHLASLVLEQPSDDTLPATASSGSAVQWPVGAMRESAATDDGLLVVDEQGRVAVDVWTRGPVAEALAGLSLAGFEVADSSDLYHVLEGLLPVPSLVTAAQLPGVLSITPVFRPLTSSGLAMTAGDAVMHADDLRDAGQFPPGGYTGAGMKVGVLADSVSRVAGGLPDSQATGDLPAEVGVLWDGIQGEQANRDEGRAMLEIVHDVAPGAELAFATALGGELALVRGIRALAAAGCDVLVDDVIYFSEPFFQDGIVAQAVDDVVAQWGLTYVSAAGNLGRNSYEAAFANAAADGPLAGYHDFDSGGGVDTRQQITLPAAPAGSYVLNTLVLQWDQPFYSLDGVTSDFDVFLYASGESTPIASGSSYNLSLQQPLEVVQWRQYDTSPTAIEVAIQLRSGQADARLKYVLFNGAAAIDEYATDSGTVIGHAAAYGAVAVGAVPYFAPGTAEPYSSIGRTSIYFDRDGQRLPAPEERAKPDLVAPDLGNTTFFGEDIPEDADSLPNFGGTSAAAAHAAGATALLKSVNPVLTSSQLRAALRNSAADLGEAGWDRVFGSGRIDLLAAQPLAAAAADTENPLASLVFPASGTRTPVGRLVVAFNEDVRADTAGDAGRYALRDPGSDGQWNTSDDRPYQLAVDYDVESHRAEIRFSAPQQVLSVGSYRLTISGGIEDGGGHAVGGGAGQLIEFSLSPWVAEFLVAADAVTPAVGIRNDGKGLVAWDDHGRLLGSLRDEQGWPQAPPLVLDDGSVSYDHKPQVDMLPDGRFVAAYGVRLGDSDWGAGAALFDADAQRVATVENVSAGLDLSPDAALAPSGEFMMVWHRHPAGQPAEAEVYGRIYDATGSPVTGEFAINQTASGTQQNARVAADGSGNFVVLWESSSQDGDGWGIVGRRYDRGGTPLGDEFPVNSLTAGDQRDPDVAAAGDGRFIAVWQSTDAAGHSTIGARAFAADAGPQGEDFPVSTLSLAAQNHPRVATTYDGNSIVVWQASGVAEGTGEDILGQWLTFAGQRIGLEFLVNNLVTAGDQLSPQAAMNDAGQTLMAWSSPQAGGGREVRARLVEPSLDLPDLAITEVTGPEQFQAGLPSDVSATYYNAGVVPSGSCAGRYYLSRDPVITEDDLPLTDAIALGGLSPLASATDVRTVVAPAGLTGSYYVGFIVDVDQSVSEFDEGVLNRRSAERPSGFTAAPPADLQVVAVDAPSTALSGGVVPVSWQVVNQGGGPTAGSRWVDRLWLSADQTLDSGDVELASLDHWGVLESGQTYSVQASVAIPHGYEGNYYVFAATDVTDLIDEPAHEDNNVAYDPVAVAVTLTPPPDLQVVSVDAPATAVAGNTIAVSWQVTNAGSGGTVTGRWLDRVYLSADASFDPQTDRVVGAVVRQGALGAGQSYPVQHDITVPDTLEGAYYIFVTTDFYNEVYEHTSEGNNAGYDGTPTAITLRPPDLTVTSVQVPETADAGQPITVTWTVRNGGAERAETAAWYDRIYLSTDETLNTASDILLDTSKHTGGLDAGAVYDASQEVYLPLGHAGALHVIVHTDYSNVVFEGTGGEDNNTASDASTVTSVVRAELPYSEPFEVASLAVLPHDWSFVDQHGQDLVELSETGSPHEGSQHLVMQSGSSTTSTQSATLAIDLAGRTGTTLDFWLKEIADPTGLEASAMSQYVIIIIIVVPCPGCGSGGGGPTGGTGQVQISQDGDHWYTLTTIDGQAEYPHYAIDLDAKIAQHALDPDRTLYLRFSHTGRENWGAFAWDDVRLSSGIDLRGPHVASLTPASLAWDAAPLNQITLTFDEPIDVSSFSVQDVVLKAPSGASIQPLNVAAVAGSGDQQFTISFPNQNLRGGYRLSVGPDVLDLAGNAMNSDDDALLGESSDAYTATIEYSSTKTAVPSAAAPVMDGFEGASLATYWGLYSTGTGTVSSTTGGSPHGGTSHLLFDQTGLMSQSAVWHVDLTGLAGENQLWLDYRAKSASDQLLNNQTYVELSADGQTWHTMLSADVPTAYTHYVVDLDQELSEAQIDLQAQPDVLVRFRQYTSTAYSGWSSDLYLDDVALVIGDRVGPRVTGHVPGSLAVDGGPLNQITLTFSEAIDIASFTVTDMVLKDPRGVALTPVTLAAVAGSGDTQFTLSFAEQNLRGQYRLSVGPDVLDLAGNAMDQDQDSAVGEASDVYAGTVQFASTKTAVPSVASPVVDGFESVPLATYWALYSTDSGTVSWTTGGSPHGGTSHLLFDQTGLMSQSAVWHVDLTGLAGENQLWLDYWARSASDQLLHNQTYVELSAAGQTWHTMLSAYVPTAYTHYVVDLDQELSEAQIDLQAQPDVLVRFRHYTSTVYSGWSSDLYLDDVAVVIGDRVGPRVTGHVPGSLAVDGGPLNQISLTFSEAIDVASFTATDVVLKDPRGVAITPVTVAVVVGSGDTQFTLSFADQNLRGQYRLSVGPDVLDLVGNAMDQNQDSAVGEGSDVYAGAVQFASTKTAVPSVASPVVDGFETVPLATYWGLYSADSGTVTWTTGGSPHGGTSHLLFDQTGLMSQSAVWHLDLTGLAGENQLWLDYWAKSASDQLLNNQTYVELSADGQTWHTMLSADVPTAYTHYVIDLDRELSEAQIDLQTQPDVLVRFRQYTSTAYSGWSSDLYLDDVALVIGDRIGPWVTGHVPVSLAADGGPLNQITLTFSEAIDIASLTAADVVLKDPRGIAITPVTVAVVAGSGDTQFTLSFADQNLRGQCRMSVGPNVLDLVGNAMDQDQDSAVGEGSDVYAPPVHFASTKTAVPSVASPVVDGFENAPLATYWGLYSAGSGTVTWTTGGSPHGGTSHLLFDQTGLMSQSAVLHVDLTGLAGESQLWLDYWAKSASDQLLNNQTYVELSADGQTWHTMLSADVPTAYTHYVIDLDQELSEAQIDLQVQPDVLVRFRQHTSTAYSGWSSDLYLDDVSVVIGDRVGPRVTAQTPSGSLNGPISSLQLTFSETIDLASFTAADVAVTGSAGNTVTLRATDPIEDRGDQRTFTIHLASPQVLAGRYRVTVGPNVTDLSGNVMNQNGDVVQGDAYVGTLDINPEATALLISEGFEDGDVSDLGAMWHAVTTSGSTSVVASHARSGTYSIQTYDGNGHNSTSYYQDFILHLDLAGETDVILDFWVKEYSGTASDATVAISGNGTAWTTAVSVAGAASYQHYVIDLDVLGVAYTADTQIRFRHSSYSGGGFAWDDIRVRSGGPAVDSHTPAGLLRVPSVSSLRFVFNEPMDTGSFAAADDVVSFSGPGGDLRSQITGHNWIDNQTLEIQFSGVSAPGPYTMVIGPDITDDAPHLNAMDQNSNGTPGQTSEDRYTATFEIARSLYAANMDTDPAWTFSAGSGDYRWQWGVPAGLGGDPAAGYTGSNVVGYNLQGAYPNYMTVAQYATTPAIDTRGYGSIRLGFSRWLGVQSSSYDHAAVEASNDGTTWVTVWNHTGGNLIETSWSYQEYDISAVANDQPTVYVRWSMGTTNYSTVYCGWNIDDVYVTGRPLATAQSVSSPAADGAYSEGSVLPITVTFSEAVTVTGTPQLTLETGAVDRLADYIGGSGTATLTFNYTVLAGDTSSDLDYANTAALALNGGTILDAAGNEVILILPEPGSAGSLGANKDLVIAKLIVTRLTPAVSGFVARFSRPVDVSVLNLYDSAAGSLGPPDVTLVGASTGPVPGSIVVSESNQEVTFVRTGGRLAADTYTVTFRSAADGFREPAGDLLDGNADGVVGDHFSTTFTVADPPAGTVTIRLPDMARGAGQAVNIPNTAGGLPMQLDNADGVTSLAVDVVYDLGMLQITAATLAAGVPPDWTVALDTAIPGVTKITASGTTPLSGTDVEVVRLTAAVPSTAPYGAVQAIRLDNVSLNGGEITAVGDVAVHKAAYLGDADGSGIHSSADAFLTVQAALGLASGFAAHSWTDPRIVGDADGSGVLSAADAFLIVQEGLGQSEPFVPDNPHITVTPVGGGVDPQFRIDVDIPASAGGLVTVAVNLAIEAAANNVGAIEFDLFFDPSRLTIHLPEGIAAGADTADDWAVSSTLVAAGHLRVGMVSSHGQPLSPGLREIAFLQFQVAAGAAAGTTSLDIESHDPRAGGLTWTALDGSVLLGPSWNHGMTEGEQAGSAAVYGGAEEGPSARSGWVSVATGTWERAEWIELSRHLFEAGQTKSRSPAEWPPAAFSSWVTEWGGAAAAGTGTSPMRAVGYSAVRNGSQRSLEAVADAVVRLREDLGLEFAALEPLLDEIVGDIAAAWA